MGWTYAKGLVCYWIFIHSYSMSLSYTASCSLPFLSLQPYMCFSHSSTQCGRECVHVWVIELSGLCRHSKGVCEHFLQTKICMFSHHFWIYFKKQDKHRALVSFTELWTLNICFTEISYPLPYLKKTAFKSICRKGFILFY